MYNVTLCSTWLYSSVYALHVFLCSFDDLQDSLNMVPSELKHVRIWYNVDKLGWSFLTYCIFCLLID